ncbi:hypothetical protein Tco_0266114 [Tanacetum coccineum]
MEKNVISSYTDSEEMEMERLQKKAHIMKDSCLNDLSALKPKFTLISKKDVPGITASEFEHAFSRIFGEKVDTFTRTFSQNIDTLEIQLTKETIHESYCQTAFRVLKTPFEKIFTSVLIQSSSLDECKVQEVKTSDASSGDKDSNGIVSDRGNDESLENQSKTPRDESNGSRNECNDKRTSRDDMNIKPSYDTKPMSEVDRNTTPDSSDICNSEFKDDQNADNHESEHVVLADLIANLKFDIDENKKIQKQLRNANTSLTQELKECKSTLEETNRTLRESNSTRDSCLIAL